MAQDKRCPDEYHPPMGGPPSVSQDQAVVNRLGHWSGSVMPLVERDPRILAAIVVVGFVPLFAFAAADVGGQAVLWENAHWTLSALAAVTLGVLFIIGIHGPENL